MDPLKIISRFKPVKANIIPALHALQNSQPDNYLPEDALKEAARYFGVNLSWIYGVTGYYSMFSLQPRGRHIIRLCNSPVCNMMGSTAILDAIGSILGIGAGQTTPDGIFTIELSECLGLCDSAPAMMINSEVYGNLTPELLHSIIDELRISQKNNND